MAPEIEETADPPSPFAAKPTFTTLVATPLQIEGLTGTAAGELYTVARGSTPCPVWRVVPSSPSPILEVMGHIAVASCSPAGLAFDAAGDLYVAQSPNVYKLTPNAAKPPNATIFASGVPGTNGLVFDKRGNLWTTDGTTGQGRVWKIDAAGAVTERFRIPPMRNGTTLGGLVTDPADGVGRQVRVSPPATLTVAAAGTVPGGQDLVANGIALTTEGDLLISDTARGAIWRARLNTDGALLSAVNCDSTLPANTLCMDNVWVAHPLLEGADGIALDVNGNVWVSDNERNALVVVMRSGQVREVFRNPVNASGLRNAATSSADDIHVLEFPTSPYLLGTKLCTANSDVDRRDNSPNTGGELAPAGAYRGKISCMDQALLVQGLPLPIAP